MTTDRAMNWVLGIAFVAMFAMHQLAIYDRDTARRATIEMNGALITVTCKPITTSEGGE